MGMEKSPVVAGVRAVGAVSEVGRGGAAGGTLVMAHSCPIKRGNAKKVGGSHQCQNPVLQNVTVGGSLAKFCVRIHDHLRKTHKVEGLTGRSRKRSRLGPI